MDKMLDLYTDFIIACPGQICATTLSSLTESKVSHDQVTRMLSSFKADSQSLWKMVKPLCQEVGSDDAVLIIDDCIVEKKHSKTNELICYHYDHTIGRSVKGINFVSALYHTCDMSIPVGAMPVLKDKPCVDKKGNIKMKASVSKNEHFRNLVAHGALNMRIAHVLSDSWYANGPNMQFVKEKGLNFIMAIKENRKVALSVEDKKAGNFVPIKDMAPEGDVCVVWFKQLDFPVLITRQVFKDGDEIRGVLYLASSDLKLNASQVTTIYQRRWKVEQYHKSLKQVCSIGASPAWKVHTQTAHFYASIMAFVKVEILTQRHKKNHFALKSLILKKAAQAAWAELDSLSLRKQAA